VTLDDVLAEIERGELTSARLVFATAELEPMREAVTRAIEQRMRADDAFAFLLDVKSDQALPQALRDDAVWCLDHQPAGPDHREFLRRFGKQSIDDFD
jgi:hypothetical protein